MSDPASLSLPLIQPLTVLTEEEQMFQAAAREFAEKEIGPHVEPMDREGKFRPELIEKFFEQGFMGLSVPEAYGGSGGSFFMSVLAIEEFSR
ncbi:MAG: acyl-CoA dehydrogenase family protein, partial [Terriglobia bacterium]